MAKKEQPKTEIKAVNVACSGCGQRIWAKQPITQGVARQITMTCLKCHAATTGIYQG